ncbi:hypothetical protein CVD28_12885 [Bacillus sp. M6-12]|uniref:hypothetical protein n=1 Tax=Bacillus sp. M6-12 TaxID=2054166 RepID=UPI000C75C8B8|nr:hypothetical protein [Bacillus sp. M6-12]PLS17439.1 hypothetical protein CVD28_12885 [Bacillus sp. M6-12]
MELGVKKTQRKTGRAQTISGFLSFLTALIALSGVNAALLIKTNVFPNIFLIQFPFIGVFLGIVGLLTRKRSRMFAWWGLGLNTFILIFTFMMFIFAMSINAKP